MVAPHSVLIVDDEPHVRTYIRLMLKQLGVSLFFEAENGRQGVEKYRETQPDLVLLDINMPVMDGLAALDAIQAADPDAVCVMLTAEATRQAVERSGKLGAVHFIRKDTPKSALQKILSDLFTDLYEDEEEVSE